MKVIFNYLFLFLIIMASGVGSICYAVTIGNISGEISNGQTIVINGNNFGSKSTANPLVSSYHHGTEANNFSSGAIGGDWLPRFSIRLSSNSQYLRTRFNQSSHYAEAEYSLSGYSAIGYDTPASTGTYFYTSIWYQVTNDIFCASTNSANSKFWRWYVNPTGGDGGTVSENFAGVSPGGCSSGYETDVNNVGIDGGQGDRIDYLQPTHPLGEWFHHEVWVFAGTNNGTNGRYVEKVNGKKVRDWNGWGIINSARPHTANYLRFGKVSGSNYAGGSILMDSMYVDNTQAHVFISDRNTMPSNWLNTTTESYDEIQVCSQWNTGQITCTVNQGNFTSGQTAYLYVVDANGNVNTQGYRFTFGSLSSGADPDPEPDPEPDPKEAPANLRFSDSN
jgi:hypothetical protein